VTELTPLEEIAARAERLVALSSADATSIAWVESREGAVVESARTRRAGLEVRRSVLFRVRVGGRTGRARAESALPGDLQRSLRAALADARCGEPSPDWSLEAATREPAALADLADPQIAALDPAAVQRDLQSRAEKRSTLRLRWREHRLAVAASFHPTRSATLTDVTFEARTGRRPGSGFAARSARRLAALDLDALVAAARALEAPAIDPSAPEDVPAVVLAPEAVAVLLDAVARRALAGGRRLAGGKAPDLRLPADLRLVDDPLDPRGVPLPFDLDGCAKRPRVFVERGWVVGVAADLDLAARLGLEPTAHALAGDDAWPDHLALDPGAASETELLAAAGGGLRIGALEELAVEPGEAMPFRTVARNVRRIGAAGELAEGLAPLVWRGTLRDLFADLVGIGRDAIAWSPRSGSTGAIRTPPIALKNPGHLTPRRF
jgi:predicted Zn-dependent protease